MADTPRTKNLKDSLIYAGCDLTYPANKALKLAEELERELADARRDKKALAEVLSERTEALTLPEGSQWLQVNRGDERFKRAAFIPFDAQYVCTLKSNGPGYDNFILAVPPVVPKVECMYVAYPECGCVGTCRYDRVPQEREG